MAKTRPVAWTHGAYQIDLEAVMDAIDMKTFGLMAAIGKIELDSFRERASMGKRGAAKQGRIPVNNVPFGYRLGEDRRPQVVEAEAEIIRRVFHMYVREGMGAPAIARQLTAEGVPTPQAVGRWYDRTVTRILGTEACRGTWWFGKVRHVATENGMRRYDRPEDEWVGVPFPPLVDQELWEQAQEAKKQRLTRSGRNTKTFYLLQHLVRCAECGYLMTCRTNRRQTVRRGGKAYRYELDPPVRYYCCNGKLNIGATCRKHPLIRAEHLEGLVWREVKKMLENPGLIVAGIEALNSQADGGGLAEEIAKAERDLQKVQMEEDRAIRLYVSGKITEAQLDHQVLLEPPVAGCGSGEDDRIDLVDAGLPGLLLLVGSPIVIAVAVPGGLPGRLVPLVRFLELQREFVPHRHQEFGYQGQPLELGHCGGDVPGPGLLAAGFRVLQVQSPPGCRLFPCDRAVHVGLSLLACAVLGQMERATAECTGALRIV